MSSTLCLFAHLSDLPKAMFWTPAARESDQPRSSSDLIRYSLSPDHARPRPLPHASLPDAYSPQPGHPYASSASTSHHSYPPPYPDEAIHTPAPFVPPRAPRPRPSRPHPPRGGGPDDDVQGYFLQAPSSAAHGHQQHVPPGQAPQAYHEESWRGEPHWSGGEGVERLGGGEEAPMAGFHDAQQALHPCPPFQRQHFLPLPQPQHPHPQFLHRRHKQPQPASYPSAGPLPPSSAPMSVGAHVDSAAPPLVYRHNVSAPLASTASSSPVSSSSHGGGLVRRPSNTFPSTTTTNSSGASSVAHHLERSLYVDPAGAAGPLGSDQGLALVSASSRTWDSLSRTFGYEHSFDKVEEENVDGGGQFLSPSSLSGADFSSSSDGHPSGPASHDGQHSSIQQQHQQQQQLQQHPHLLTMQEHSHHHLQSLSSSLSSSFSSPLSSFLQSHDRPSAPSSTTHSSLWSGIGDGIGDGSLSYGPSSARHDSSHHLLQPVLLSQSHYEVPPPPPPQISSSSESSSSLLREGEGESEVETWEDDAAPAPTPPVKRPRLSTTDPGPLNSEPLRPTAAGAFFFTSASASETTPAYHLKKKVKGGPPALTPDGRPRRGKIPTSCAECRCISACLEGFVRLYKLTRV